MCNTQKFKKNICCNICNKLYSSKSSLCNHKKIYHKSNNIITQNTNQNINKDINPNIEINNELLNSNSLIQDLIITFSGLLYLIFPRLLAMWKVCLPPLSQVSLELSLDQTGIHLTLSLNAYSLP